VNGVNNKFSPRRFGGLLAILALLAGLQAPAARAAEVAVTMDQTKAAVLLRIAEFTTWPALARQTNGGGLVVGIVNSTGIVAAARAFVAADTKDRTLVVVVDSLEQAAACHVLYVGETDELAGKVLAAARSRPVLTVGEGVEFLTAGGIVGFAFREERGKIVPDYYLSVEAMDRARIRLDVRIVKKGLKPGEAAP